MPQPRLSASKPVIRIPEWPWSREPNREHWTEGRIRSYVILWLERHGISTQNRAIHSVDTFAWAVHRAIEVEDVDGSAAVLPFKRLQLQCWREVMAGGSARANGSALPPRAGKARPTERKSGTVTPIRKKKTVM